MISVRLDPADETRLNDLASRRGETAEETARRILLDRLDEEEGWSEISEEDLAKSCGSMMARSLPDEDWSDFAEGTDDDGSR